MKKASQSFSSVSTMIFGSIFFSNLDIALQLHTKKCVSSKKIRDMNINSK